MATVNLGRVGFVNKGNYTQSTNYKVNDVVKYGLEVFACITAHKSPSSGFDSSKWIQWVGNDDVKVARAYIAVTVGVSGKDFTTVKAAIEYLSQFAPIYKKGGIIAEIKIEDGYILKEQLLFDGVDLSFIRISYEGSGYLLVDRDYITRSFDGLYPVFGARNGANSPQLNLVFDCQVEQGSSIDADEKHGIFVKNATISCIGTAGAVRCSGFGAYVKRGVLQGAGLILASDKRSAGYINYGGLMRADTITTESRDGIGLYVQQSTVSASSISAKSHYGYGIYLRGGGNAEAETIEAYSATTRAVYARGGSNLSAYTLEPSNSAEATAELVGVDGGSSVRSNSGTWTNNGSGDKCNVAAGTISSNGYVNRIG